MKVMRRYNDPTIWFAAFLLVFSAGCSDNDKAGTNQTVTLPTVISVTPLSAASACSNTLVTATFSKAMNPATINGTTFTLTGPGAAAVGGAVTYDAPRDTATFTSAATLALGTGLGGSHPPVQVTADTLSTRLPCLLVTLGDHPGVPLRELLGITTAETATGVPA